MLHTAAEVPANASSDDRQQSRVHAFDVRTDPGFEERGRAFEERRAASGFLARPSSGRWPEYPSNRPLISSKKRVTLATCWSGPQSLPLGPYFFSGAGGASLL